MTARRQRECATAHQRIVPARRRIGSLAGWVVRAKMVRIDCRGGSRSQRDAAVKNGEGIALVSAIEDSQKQRRRAGDRPGSVRGGDVVVGERRTWRDASIRQGVEVVPGAVPASGRVSSRIAVRIRSSNRASETR